MVKRMKIALAGTPVMRCSIPGVDVDVASEPQLMFHESIAYPQVWQTGIVGRGPGGWQDEVIVVSFVDQGFIPIVTVWPSYQGSIYYPNRHVQIPDSGVLENLNYKYTYPSSNQFHIHVDYRSRVEFFYWQVWTRAR